jgi:PAS domain S-box-containing protein
LSGDADVAGEEPAGPVIGDAPDPAFELLFERHPSPMWVFDVETLGFLAVNEAATRLYGWRRDELLRKTLLDIRPPEDRPLLLARLRVLGTAGDGGVTGPWRHVTAGGEVRMVQVRSQPLRFRGRAARLVVLWDITERVRAEAAVQDYATRLHATFESISDGIYALDEEDRFTHVNGQAERLLRHRAADLLGRRLWEIFPEARRTELPDRFAHARSSRETVRFEFFFRPFAAWYEVCVYPAANGLTVSFRDVTQERGHAALLERQTTVLDEAGDAIVICGLDHRVLYWNRTAERLYGWTAAEMVGHGRAEAVWDDPDAFRAAHAAVLRNRRWSGRVTQRCQDGRQVTVQAAWSLIPASPYRAASILMINSDLAEVVQLEQQLAQASRLEAIGRLTGGIAHDFNNLLTIVLGSCEALAEALAADPDLGELARTSLAAAERGAELTGQLLAFSRKQPLDPRPVDVNALVSGMGGMLRRTLGDEVLIRIDAAPGTWPARADAAQLENALLNLCINARDAMMPGGGTLDIATGNVELDRDDPGLKLDLRPGPYVMISVTDTGSGMTPEVLSRIFDPFFTTKGVGEGSGLGMSMVYGFVKQSEGHIRVESQPGAGTVVQLFLPKAAGGAEPRPPAARIAVPGAGERILVVEDNELLRMQVCMQMTGLGYAVTAAPDGREALKLLREGQPFDLLFTDLAMPGGVDGRQLAVRAMALRPGLRVLLTSGYAEAEPAEAAAAPLPLLRKPYRRSELASQLRAALRPGREGGVTSQPSPP